MAVISQRQIRVLHVDDEPEITDLTASFLQREDDRFTVETTLSADDGLDELDDRPPDCIISDYNMPGTDGLEFLQAVREEYPDLPFIFFTGKGSEEVASDAISAGATDYLQKQSGTDQYKLLANRILNAVTQYRSEKRLRETQKEYSTVFENAQNAFLLVDIEDDGFRYQQCNPQAVELIGRDRTEIIGERPGKVLGPENGRKVVGAYRKCVQQRKSVAYTVTLDFPMGRIIRDSEVTPVSSDGEIEQLVVEFRDITEEKERRRELEEYETIIEALTDAVYVLDKEGRFTYVNDEFVELVGYDRETILGNTPSLIKDEKAVEQAEHQLGRLLSSDGPETVTFEVTIQPQDGDPIDCEDQMGVLPYDGDQFDGSVGTLRDTTDRKEHEQELQELKSQYETLAENFPNGAVFLINADLECVRAGGEELSNVDLSSNEVEGTKPHALFPEEIADELCHYYEEALDGNANTFEQVYGGERYRVQTVPIRADTDEIDHLMAVSQNITERAENKREIERQNERLEEFTRIVSHDLRNPLQVADGRLTLIDDECESDHIDDVARALDRMEALIEDLLTLARKGEQVDETESVGLATVAKESWQTVDTEQAALETDTPRAVKANQSRLRQLFENLYRNAVEHGGDDVTVSVGERDNGFYVADTGPGIPESDREEVFKAGYSSSTEGTGFGLRIVKQVADAHGWEAAVTESDQGGARFEFTGVEFADR